MTQTVSRIYGTSTQARAAVEELKSRRYTDVYVFTAPERRPAPEGAEGAAPVQGPSTAQLAGDMMKAYIYRPLAHAYAAKVANGASLVAVHAPFGAAQLALDILDSHSPLPEDTTAPARASLFAYDDRAVFSSSLCLPVLSETKLPMETVLGLSSVTNGRWLFTSTFMPMLTRVATPLSRALGLSTSSRDATPFSGRLGLPLRSDRTFSSRLGFPLLVRK